MHFKGEIMKIKIEEHPEVVHLDNVLYEIYDENFLEVHFVFGSQGTKLHKVSWKFSSEERYKVVKSHIQGLQKVTWL